MSLAEILRAHNAARPSVRVKLSDVLFQCACDDEFIVRVLVTGEIADAVAAAVEERKRVIGAVPEQQRAPLLEDPTILEDAKTVEMLWRACRDAGDPSVPAFPSSKFMRDHMTAEEMDTLASFYSRACAAASRIPRALTVPERNAMAVVIAANKDSDGADAVLLAMPKPALVDWAVWLAGEWARLGGGSEALRTESNEADPASGDGSGGAVSTPH